MKFQAKLDDAESRAYWDSVRRGAREYDELPEWKKGVLGGAASAATVESIQSGEEDGQDHEGV